MEQIPVNETHTTDLPLEEKRRFRRRRVLKSGTIHFNRGYNQFACQVRNLTDQGAMVQMGETIGVPQHIEFQIDGMNPVATKVIWRTSQRMGLEFEL